MKYRSALLLLCAIPVVAHAQTTQAGSLWAGASIGFIQPFSIRDGSTQSTWAFGSSTPIRISMERSIDASNSIGIAAVGATMPLTYRSQVATGGCTTCDADATVRQAMAIFRNVGGQYGLLRVLELGIGMTGFSDFKAQDGTTAIGPDGIDWDFTVSIGYGFGLRLGEQFELSLIQDLSTVIHQRTGLAGSENALPRIYVTRLGVRYRL